ncbi:MAG: ABC transporter permease [Bacteroidota bacterium]|nr:ABC transporter permease [Bacteroidota bacterium]
MFDIDRWNEIISALSKNKLRSFLTAFGVFWGIFMLVLMAGMGKGLENGIMHGVGKAAKNSAFMWTDNTSKPYKGFNRGRTWSFDNNDATYILQNVSEIENLSPRLFGGSRMGGNNTVRGHRSGSFRLKGDYPDYINIEPVTPIMGRYLNNIDIQEKRKICVIGEKVQSQMFNAGENPIGQYLKISGIYFQIVGVVHPETNININGRTEESIFLPFTTMQQVYNLGNEIHLFCFTSKKGIPVSIAEAKMMKILRERHKVDPTDEQAVAHINLEKQLQQFNMLFLGISVLVWIVGIGTLLAGVIGVSNIMLVIVKERTQEIGVMRAIGATPRKIMSQIVAESVFLTTLAGFLGLAFAVGILALVSKALEPATQNPENDVFIIDPGISLHLALAALLILILSGIFAGMIPAHRALKMKTIDALRDEI